MKYLPKIVTVLFVFYGILIGILLAMDELFGFTF
jgi:hypothetical protein